MRNISIEELQVLINHKITELSATKFSKFDRDKIRQLSNDLRTYLTEYEFLTVRVK